MDKISDAPDLLDEVGEKLTAIKDPLVPVHTELKNMSSEDFTLVFIAMVLFVGLIVLVALFRKSGPEACRHRCAVHTSA